MKKIWRRLVFFIVVLVLVFFQLYFISLWPAGWRPNLVLAFLFAFFPLKILWLVVFSGMMAGLIFSFFGFAPLVFLSFPLSLAIVYFLSKKFINQDDFLPVFFIAFIGTAIFNFFRIFLPFLFSFSEIGWHYFLSWPHLLEMFLNGFLAVVFWLIAARKSKN